jgi:hypothetical protein
MIQDKGRKAVQQAKRTPIAPSLLRGARTAGAPASAVALGPPLPSEAKEEPELSAPSSQSSSRRRLSLASLMIMIVVRRPPVPVAFACLGGRSGSATRARRETRGP